LGLTVGKSKHRNQLRGVENMHPDYELRGAIESGGPGVTNMGRGVGVRYW